MKKALAAIVLLVSLGAALTVFVHATDPERNALYPLSGPTPTMPVTSKDPGAMPKWSEDVRGNVGDAETDGSCVSSDSDCIAPVDVWNPGPPDDPWVYSYSAPSDVDAYIE